MLSHTDNPPPPSHKVQTNKQTKAKMVKTKHTNQNTQNTDQQKGIINKPRCERIVQLYVLGVVCDDGFIYRYGSSNDSRPND